MKITRFVAASMRAALAQVRTEQGADAVILSSRRLDEGIEVVAAVDYDAALFQNAAPKAAVAAAAAAAAVGAGAAVSNPSRTTAAPSTAHVAKELGVPTAVSRTPASRSAGMHPRSTAHDAARAPSGPPVAARGTPRMPTTDAEYHAMRREMRDLRDILQGGLAQMSWNDQRLRDPLQARVLDELTALDLAPDVALALAKIAPRRSSLGDPSHIPLALLARSLPVVEEPTVGNARVVALVGPTGVGKTTTIAKLASRWCAMHGCSSLALVSTDGYRIGAREQLMTYARVLGVPMQAASNGKELARVLEVFASKRLVLIDTAGIGPRDLRLSEQLAELKLGAARARILLTLPAHGEEHALDKTVRSFASVRPDACILTKVDEAASLGAAMSVILRHRLPVAYLCTGQRVPEDVHEAQERRLWLIKVAVKLKERTRPNSEAGPRAARSIRGASAHA